MVDTTETETETENDEVSEEFDNVEYHLEEEDSLSDSLKYKYVRHSSKNMHSDSNDDSNDEQGFVHPDAATTGKKKNALFNFAHCQFFFVLFSCRLDWFTSPALACNTYSVLSNDTCLASKTAFAAASDVPSLNSSYTI